MRFSFFSSCILSFFRADVFEGKSGEDVVVQKIGVTLFVFADGSKCVGSADEEFPERALPSYEFTGERLPFACRSQPLATLRRVRSRPYQRIQKLPLTEIANLAKCSGPWKRIPEN